ncbi:HD-GYP domain-containing protein [Candidatus Clostridium stratigraminis]|uniref:HD-GYP domain-containing protein n=1 Tax=Candidatus Clostridium stratigraminis TaxID=3381661 RepID=A0ABW8T383_9CLOT
MFSEFLYTDLVYSISESIDLVNPILANHHKLVAYISYSLGNQLGLTVYEQLELEIAGSLHDVGGLTNIERLAPLEFDYEDVNLHSEKGYILLNKFAPFSNIAKIIRYHHHPLQHGKCVGINGEKIPFRSHILNLADRIAILIKLGDRDILNQVENILSIIKTSDNSVFNPKIVKAFLELSCKDSFWLDMNYLDRPNYIKRNYNFNFLTITESEFENFMKVISHIVDFKSRFTAAHSLTIAACAESLASLIGFNEDEMKMIKYAGYIHDLGKLAIPTEILEKPTQLSKEEFSLMRTHSYHTNRILENVRGFDTIRQWGSMHHEKLNGRGYPYGFKDNEIPLGARIIAVADIFTALREKRPYRDPISESETINILINMANSFEIDTRVVNVLKANFEKIDSIRDKSNKDAIYEYDKFNSEFIKNKSLRLG